MRVVAANLSRPALRRALEQCLRRAKDMREAGDRTLDGHWPAASRTVYGVRISTRYNRHDQCEISVSAAQREDLLPARVLSMLHEVHRELTGATLDLRYAEPRNFDEGRDTELKWAVLRPGAMNTQPRLM